MLEYPIVTPENVRFHYTLAGPGTRLLAWLVDMVLVGVLVVVVALVHQLLREVVGGYADASLALAVFFLLTGYWILLEFFWAGTTVGKRVFGLRVIGERGLRLTLGQVLLRNVLRVVDLLPGPGGVAAVFMFFHPQHRRLGDLVAGTLVIREERAPPPDRIRGLAGSRGKQRGDATSFSGSDLARIPREEREFLIDLSLRRDRLEDAVRLELFAKVAKRLRELPSLKTDETLSDENLVLLVTAALLDRGLG